jgi:hypothetical protein
MTSYTHGPWTVQATVHADRKNIFSLEQPAFHVGTIVSGSKSKLDVFDANAQLIGAAPDLHAALHRLACILEAVREDSVSARMGFGGNEAERKERARVLAAYVEANAEKIDAALEEASAALAKAPAPEKQFATA